MAMIRNVIIEGPAKKEFTWPLIDVTQTIIDVTQTMLSDSR